MTPPERSASGYRAFDEAALGRLGFVCAAQALTQQLRGELRQLAERAATLDPEHCPPERVCHIIT